MSESLPAEQRSPFWGAVILIVPLLIYIWRFPAVSTLFILAALILAAAVRYYRNKFHLCLKSNIYVVGIFLVSTVICLALHPIWEVPGTLIQSSPWGQYLVQVFQSIPGNDPLTVSQWVGPDIATWMLNLLYNWTVPGLFIGSMALSLIWNRRDLAALSILVIPVGHIIALPCYILLPVPDPYVLTDSWISPVATPPTVFGDMKAAKHACMTAAFPSMHVGWTLALALVMPKKTLARALSLGMAISTMLIVYTCRIHWLVDILAGIPVGFLVAKASIWFEGLLRIGFKTPIDITRKSTNHDGH